jgi:cellobiose phosphorylase
MRYGHFSQDSKEFIITRPDTPRPWFNYLFNDVYHCLISQTAGGFSYFKDPKYYRILRYDHLSSDRPGRYLFLKEPAKKRIWSLNWQPFREKLDGWECRHGLGYTKISAHHHGIKGSVTYFVAKEAPVELWLTTLKNTTRQSRQIEVYPFVELVCGDVALETHYRNILCLYNEANFDKSAQAIIAFKHPFKDWHKTGFGFFSTSLPVESFECRRESFFGPYGSFKEMGGLAAKRLGDHEVRGEDMVGVFQGKLTLKPGETKEFVVVLGLTETKEEVARLLTRYRSVEAAKQELVVSRAAWNRTLERVWVETPDSNFNLMTNLWGKYQLLAITHWRGTSHYHGAEGGLGFRDTAQDVEGLLSVDIGTARAKLEKLLFYQYKSGHAVSGFSDIEGTWENQGVKGVIKKADVAVWLPYSVISYVKETGDVGFLKKEIPFHDGDSEIEQAAGMSVSEIFAQLGEAEFRIGEARVMKRLLEGPPIILATGGGAVLNADTRAMMKTHAISVWMRADLEVIVERVSRRDTRPLLRGKDPLETLKALAEARYPLYGEADVIVDVGGGSHASAVDAIVEKLQAFVGDSSETAS